LVAVLLGDREGSGACGGRALFASCLCSYNAAPGNDGAWKTGEEVGKDTNHGSCDDAYNPADGA
jgi:hypothetical protein